MEIKCIRNKQFVLHYVDLHIYKWLVEKVKWMWSSHVYQTIVDHAYWYTSTYMYMIFLVPSIVVNEMEVWIMNCNIVLNICFVILYWHIIAVKPVFAYERWFILYTNAFLWLGTGTWASWLAIGTTVPGSAQKRILPWTTTSGWSMATLSTRNGTLWNISSLLKNTTFLRHFWPFWVSTSSSCHFGFMSIPNRSIHWPGFYWWSRVQKPLEFCAILSMWQCLLPMAKGCTGLLF